jgi:hypothetical protein
MWRDFCHAMLCWRCGEPRARFRGNLGRVTRPAKDPQQRTLGEHVFCRQPCHCHSASCRHRGLEQAPLSSLPPPLVPSRHECRRCKRATARAPGAGSGGNASWRPTGVEGLGLGMRVYGCGLRVSCHRHRYVLKRINFAPSLPHSPRAGTHTRRPTRAHAHRECFNLPASVHTSCNSQTKSHTLSRSKCVLRLGQCWGMDSGDVLPASLRTRSRVCAHRAGFQAISITINVYSSNCRSIVWPETIWQ